VAKLNKMIKDVNKLKRILASLILIAAVASLLTQGAMSLFTDTETSSVNTFTAGTVELNVAGNSPLPFSVAAMAPGDSLTGTVKIENEGALELRYAMTTTGDGGSTLDEQLDCEIKVGATTLYSGKLSSAAIGNPAQGAQAGDRTLAPLAEETLTFIVSMPLSSGNSYQGTTCTVSFVFDAEQTANNS